MPGVAIVTGIPQQPFRIVRTGGNDHLTSAQTGRGVTRGMNSFTEGYRGISSELCARFWRTHHFLPDQEGALPLAGMGECPLRQSWPPLPAGLLPRLSSVLYAPGITLIPSECRMLFIHLPGWHRDGTELPSVSQKRSVFSGLSGTMTNISLPGFCDRVTRAFIGLAPTGQVGTGCSGETRSGRKGWHSSRRGYFVVASSGGFCPACFQAGRQPLDWTFIRWLSWTL